MEGLLKTGGRRGLSEEGTSKYSSGEGVALQRDGRVLCGAVQMSCGRGNVGGGV